MSEDRRADSAKLRECYEVIDSLVREVTELREVEVHQRADLESLRSKVLIATDTCKLLDTDLRPSDKDKCGIAAGLLWDIKQAADKR